MLKLEIQLLGYKNLLRVTFHSCAFRMFFFPV